MDRGRLARSLENKGLMDKKLNKNQQCVIAAKKTPKPYSFSGHYEECCQQAEGK